jgi:hypothetical protein
MPNLVGAPMNEKLASEVSSIEKRVTDVKHFNTAAITVLGILIIGATLYSNFSVSREIERLEYFEKQATARINKLLGETEGSPNVIVLSGENQPLQAQTIPAYYRHKEKDPVATIGFDVIFNNTGNKKSEPLVTKIYFRKPVKIYNTWGTADEKEYDSEIIIDASYLRYKGPLVPGLSFKNAFTIQVGSFESKDEFLPIKIKVFYGGDKPFTSEFKLHMMAE